MAGVWLWFSRFYEELAAQKELENLRKFLEDLRQKVEVYNMHGGYFSLALSRFGLNGVSHSIGYGEQKDVFPVIGRSTPTVRYYLPDLRRRLGVPQIERAFKDIAVYTSASFFDKVCGCTICRGVIQTDIKQFAAFGGLALFNRDLTANGANARGSATMPISLSVEPTSRTKPCCFAVCDTDRERSPCSTREME